MRISDWSSDVCSSDLDDLAPLHDGKVVGALRRGVGVGAHEAVLPGLAVDLLADNAGRQPLPALGLGGRMNAEALVLHRLAFLGGGLGPGRPIGRASCRERVCQYV